MEFSLSSSQGESNGTIGLSYGSFVGYYVSIKQVEGS